MKSILFLLVFLMPVPSFGQEIVLTGTPAKTIEIDQFGDRSTFNNPTETALSIVKDGENYYWASRGNIQLAVVSNGIYITYIAIDGSGYIRTINETARARFIEGTPENLVGRYTYFEHISTGLTSKTIYGR